MEETVEERGGTTDKLQAAISGIFENKEDAQNERGRERGFLHADVCRVTLMKKLENFIVELDSELES